MFRTAALVCLLAAAPLSAADVKVADLKKQSVMIDAGPGYGSGVCVKDGKKVYVWTCAHVIPDASTVWSITPEGGLVPVTTPAPAISVVREAGRDARKTPCKVIFKDKDHDLALLEVEGEDYPVAGGKFAASVPEDGEKLWHVGSMTGPAGFNSLAEGVVAATGRKRKGGRPAEDGVEYDQVSGTCQRGSSGGPVFRKDTGECVGLVSEFLGVDGGTTTPSFGAYCIIPARRIKEVAKAKGVEFAFK